jgi:tetratricopeptide (TPR) repeat protein
LREVASLEVINSSSATAASLRGGILKWLNSHQEDENSQRVLLGTLSQAHNWIGLVELIFTPLTERSVKESAIDALAQNDKWDELFSASDRWGSVEPDLLLRALKAIQKQGKASSLSTVLLNLCALHMSKELPAPVRSGFNRLRGELKLQLGDAEGAVSEFDEALSAEPNDEWVLALRGNAKRNCRRYEEAIRDFDTALTLDPDDTWDLNRRGHCKFSLRNWSGARDDFKRALENGSTERPFLKYLARSLMFTDELSEAVRVAERAVDADFMDSTAYAFRGDVRLARGERVLGLWDFEQAQVISPRYAYAIRQMGVAARLEGDLERSRTALNKAIDIDPGSAFSRLELAETLLLEGEYQLARAQLSSVSENDEIRDWATYLTWLLAVATKRDADRPTAGEDSSESGGFARWYDALWKLLSGDPTSDVCAVIVAAAGERRLRAEIVPSLELHQSVTGVRGGDVVANLLEWARGRLHKLSRERTIEDQFQANGDSAVKADTPASTDMHPVYCPLRLITGFETFKERANSVLTAYASVQRSIVLLTVNDEWVYGQCNFKMDPKEDPYDLKFIDLASTVMQRNLKIFADGHVRQLLFVERELRDKFESFCNDPGDHDKLLAFSIFSCRLVPEPRGE